MVHEETPSEISIIGNKVINETFPLKTQQEYRIRSNNT